MNYNEFRTMQDQEFKEFTKDKLIYTDTIDHGLEPLTVELEPLDVELKPLEDIKLEPLEIDINNVKPLTDGVYIVKSFEDDFNKFLEQQRRKEHEYILSNLYEVIKSELWTYEVETSNEYNYKGIITRVVGLNPVEVEEYKDVIVKAIDDYKTEFYNQD